MTTKRNVTVTTVEWADLHMVDVKSTTENTMKETLKGKERKFFPMEEESKRGRSVRYIRY